MDAINKCPKCNEPLPVSLVRKIKTGGQTISTLGLLLLILIPLGVWFSAGGKLVFTRPGTPPTLVIIP